MRFHHCSNCNKKTGHKRALGWGTFFAVLITAGLWLLIIPLYPKRCIICGYNLSSSRTESVIKWVDQHKKGSRELSVSSTTFWALVLIFIALLLAVIFDVTFAFAKPKIYGDATVIKVISVYDGDTFFANIKGHPDISGKNIGIRIYGIDTPEIRGTSPKIKTLAFEAKDFVIKRFRKGKTIILKNTRRGKYFRIVAEVWIDGISLGKELIKAKMAKPYFGGKRIKWQESKGKGE